MNSSSCSVGIVGASGYSGELLVRLLFQHPNVSLQAVASRSLAGQRVDACLPRLRGLVGDLAFVSSDPSELASRNDVDVWFLALPHGVASEYALPLVEAGAVVIDLSADYRLHDASVYKHYYGENHPAPEWLERVPYVLPEYSDPSWTSASLIACPGCYPTSILLPLLPLIKAELVDPNGITINSLSGVSGAGKKATEMYSFCERENSIIAYGMGKHRHLAEIEEQLNFASGSVHPIQFTPHLVPIARGIFSTIVAKAKVDLNKIYSTWTEAYNGEPAIDILPSGTAADTLRVIGRNRIEMSAVADSRTGNIIITSAIDNLMKGASGQAIQILNTKMGWPCLTGLE